MLAVGSADGIQRSTPKTLVVVSLAGFVLKTVEPLCQLTQSPLPFPVQDNLESRSHGLAVTSVCYHELLDEMNSCTYTPGLSACFNRAEILDRKFTSFSWSLCSDDDAVITSLHKIVPILYLNEYSSTLITDKIFYRGYY